MRNKISPADRCSFTKSTKADTVAGRITSKRSLLSEASDAYIAASVPVALAASIPFICLITMRRKFIFHYAKWSIPQQRGSTIMSTKPKLI